MTKNGATVQSAAQPAEAPREVPPEESVAAAQRAWTGMRAMVLDRYDRRKEVSNALGLSFYRAKALRRLDTDGPLSMRELSEKLVTDRPYTTLIVDDLEKLGYVARTVSETDRRSKIVSVTPAGQAIAQRYEALLSEPPEPFVALAREDLAALDRIVQTLLAAAGEE